MASYQLTEDAEADVDGMYEYSILHFGLQQARDYVNGLHGCFGHLADSPRLGRDYSHVKANVRRFEYQSHSVYYTYFVAARELSVSDHDAAAQRKGKGRKRETEDDRHMMSGLS